MARVLFGRPARFTVVTTFIIAAVLAANLILPVNLALADQYDDHSDLVRSRIRTDAACGPALAPGDTDGQSIEELAQRPPLPEPSDLPGQPDHPVDPEHAFNEDEQARDLYGPDANDHADDPQLDDLAAPLFQLRDGEDTDDDTPANHQPKAWTPPAALAALLGPDAPGAKLVVDNAGVIEVIDLNTGARRQMIAPLGEDNVFSTISRPYWSRDGKRIIASSSGRALIFDTLTGLATPAIPDRVAHEPQFWTDPSTAEECIIFMTDDTDPTWPTQENVGRTFRYRPATGQYETLADFPCDGGLSPDGRFLADTVGHAMLRDRSRNLTYILNHGDIACNGSTAPDNSHRFMHLIWPHERFGVRNKYDRLVWAIRKPRFADEWDNPRWSNHPDLCTAVVRCGAERYITIVRISTGRMVVLRKLEGDFYVPQLWTASAAIAAQRPPDMLMDRRVGRLTDDANRKLAQSENWGAVCDAWNKSDNPADKLALRTVEAWVQRRLAEAGSTSDPFQAESICRELNDRFLGYPVAVQAAQLLGRADLAAHARARRDLETLMQLAGRLRNVPGADPIYSDLNYRKQNAAVLDEMTRIVDRMLTAHADAEVTQRAVTIADTWALPVDTNAFAPPRNDKPITVDLVVEAVSQTPSLRQIAPYRSALIFVRYRVERVTAGAYNYSSMIVAHQALRDGVYTSFASLKPGDRRRLTVDRLEAHPELDQIPRSMDADDPGMPAYWPIACEAR